RALQEATDAYVGAARDDPDVARVFTTFRASAPQLYADIDRVKAEKLGVPLANVFDTLQVYLGSVYVNDFNRFGRTFQVRAQAERAYRAEPEDVVRIKTRNHSNGMVPLGSVVNLQWRTASDRIVRYNTFPAAERALRHVAARPGQQPHHADRLHHADRAGRKERRAHRRVREAAAGGGQGPLRGRRRGEPAAPPADPDDLVRVHPGRAAARARD